MRENSLSSSLRILLVQEHANDRQAFRKALKTGGILCEITECLRADDALERIENAHSPFDLLVVDHELPGMSGLDMCRQMVKLKVPSALVFLTPAGAENLVGEALKIGATGYVVKDVSRGYLSLLPGLVPEAVKKCRDRLARTQTEEALRESEEKYRFLSENMMDMVWLVGRDFRTTYVSPSIVKVLGFTPEERKLQSLEEAITPESYQRVQTRFLEELLSDKEGSVDPNRSVVIEVEYYRKDGSTVWMENRVQAMRDSENAIVGIFGVSRDITERKKAEEKSQKARREWEEIFQIVGQPMLILDEDRHIMKANKMALKVTGKREREIIGKRCSEIYCCEDPAPATCPFEQMLATGRLETVEMEVENLNGHFLILCTPIFDRKGRIEKVIHTATDITDHKAQEVLVHEVNHRVKNNLSAIISMIHQEEERALERTDQERIPQFHDLASRIQGLLTVHSMLSQGGWRPLNLHALCEEIIAGIQKGVSSSKKILVHVAQSPVAVNSTIAHHLALVVNELATNTGKHALDDRDICRITVKIKRDGEDVTICFKDDGPGYPEAIVRGNGSGENTGFQLIRGIVTQSLGGKVHMENKDGAMATIYFRNKANLDEGEVQP